MPEVSWVKLSTGFLDNRKIKQLRTLPQGDSVVLMWVFLLCLAGKTNDSGCVRFTDEIPYTDEMLANEFQMDISVIRMGLEVFQKFGMLEIINDVMYLPGWNKYQAVDKLDEMREKNRQRVAQFRARKKLELAEGKQDDEKKAEKKKEPSPEFLELYEKYPRKGDKLLGFEKYTARRNEGFTHEQLSLALERYVKKCQREKTEPKYVKMISTFFGPHKPFLDFLDGVDDESKIDDGENPYKEYGG